MQPNLIERIGAAPLLKQLGPGLITGAADDDPSGIATYSQAGAQFGFNLLWTVILTYPLMAAIQLVSARIGLVTGRGLAANIRRAFPKPLLYGIVLLFALANTINIAADIAAMADAVHLFVGGPRHLYSLLFGLVCLGLQVFLPYQRTVRYLKWLTLALLAYVAVVFTVHVPWGAVALASVWPRLSRDNASLLMIVAIFGTGMLAVPIMALMMLLASSRRIMGDFTLSLRHRVLGWLATAVMLVAVLAMFWSWW